MTVLVPVAMPLVPPCDDDPLDDAEVAAAAFLARYQGRTQDAYRYDLRAYFQSTADSELEVLGVTRPQIELYVRWMEERGLAATTIDRRLSTVCGFYRFAHHRWTHLLQPRPVRPPPEGPSQRRPRPGPVRARRLPLRRRALRPRPRRSRRPPRAERAAGQ
jgi:hypothetical protein